MIRDIYYELIKMCNQKKNYITLGGYGLFLVLCYVAFSTSTSIGFHALPDWSMRI